MAVLRVLSIMFCEYCSGVWVLFPGIMHFFLIMHRSVFCCVRWEEAISSFINSCKIPLQHKNQPGTDHNRLPDPAYWNSPELRCLHHLIKCLKQISPISWGRSWYIIDLE